MSPHAPSSRRRVGPILLLCGLLAAASGCEEPDETIRGAGSIDVPSTGLLVLPRPEEEETPQPAAPGRDAILHGGPIPADQYFIPNG